MTFLKDLLEFLLMALVILFGWVTALESNENENADTDASPSQENDGTAPRRTTAVQPVPNLPRAFVHFGSPNLEQCVLSLGQSDYPSSTALFKRRQDDSDSSSSPPRKTQVASLLYAHRHTGNASSRLVADSISYYRQAHK